MNIERVIVGELEENCYLLKENDSILIIDPGDEFNKIKVAIDKIGGSPIGIIITHHHFDHIGALKEVKNYYDIPVYDRHNLKEESNKIGEFEFRVYYTPGHTDDSISIYFKKYNILFSGDFIFQGSIGRTDLGGNMIDMKKSISKILSLPSNTEIYPGHGDKTTLAKEVPVLNYYKNI